MPDVEYHPDDDETPEGGDGKTTRPRLWELAPAYRCSVIGTCLSVPELRRLARKAGHGELEKADDAPLHARLVKVTGQQGKLAKLAHRALDKKFGGTIRKLGSVDSADELYTLWSEDADADSLAGLLWAVMTHPQATADVQRQAHSEVHMMAHLALQATLLGASYAGDLEEQAERLDEELRSARQGYRKAIAERDDKIKQQAEEISKLKRLRGQLADAEQRAEEAEAYDCDGELVDEVDRVRTAHAADLDRATDAESQLAKLHKELSRLQRVDARRQQELERLEAVQRETSAELEDLLVGGAADPCVDCRTGPCPGARMCGRKILYVGGRAHLVRYYREAVERRGAEFLHHDGGVEENLSRLHGMMDTVDAVMCATDAVSHRAALGVKRACKSRSKPFIPLRNSSLSTLASGLEELESEHF